jgi:hypothetical protein
MEIHSTFNPWAHRLPPELKKLPEMDPKEQFYRMFQTEVAGMFNPVE